MRAATVFLAVLLAACSSTPPPPEGVTDRKNQAADFMKSGQAALQAAQYAQALQYYQMALDLNTAVDNVSGMAVAWNSVATIQTAMGRIADAKASMAQAKDLAEASGDRKVILQVAVNFIQADLAAGNYDSAAKRLEALKPFPESAEGASLEHAQGTLLKATDQPIAALAAYDRALNLNKRLSLKQDMATNHFMKASVLDKLERWPEALNELQAALALDRVMENTLGIGIDWRAIGTVYLKTGKPSDAFDAYVRATRLFQAAGLPDQQRRTIQMLLPVTVSLGRAEETARYKAMLDKLNALNP
jgi:tetratricopeptide (TPR) repeat protein